MTQFGQGLLPKIYRDQTSNQFTKSGFVSRLCKALKTVGMVPIVNVWPWDPMADAEFAPIDGSTNIFPFDYPDTTTFTFGGGTWRPCIAVCAWYGGFTGTTGPTNAQNYLMVFDCIRKAGTFNLADLYNLERERNPGLPNFAFGSFNSVLTAQFDDYDGAELLLADWKPYASFGGNDQAMLAVDHFFTYLGPAGLFVYVGSGTTVPQFGDKMAFGFGFGGARIPGRELVPDPDLNHICPVFPMYLRASGSGNDMFDTATGRLRTLIHGIEYRGKAQQFPVRAYLFNLENLERPVFSHTAPDSVPSPRVVTGGGAAHILGRIVIVPNDKENNTGDFYSRVEPSISNSEVRPLWGETYTCPSLRFCDRTASLGDHEDPVTLTNWWITPMYHTSSLLALKSENVVLTSSLDFGAFTSTGEDYLNMIGTPNAGTAFTFPNLGAGIIAPVVANSTTAGAALSWADNVNGALDQVTCTTAGATTSNSCTMDWVCQQNVSDPVDTVYRVSFEAKNVGGATTENGNRLEFNRFFQGAYPSTPLLSLTSAGTNGSHPSFNFQTFTFLVTVDSTVVLTKNLRFRWQAFKNLAANGNVVTVRNVRIQKFRYL